MIALFSATQNSNHEALKKQIMWTIVSIPVMIVLIIIDYDTIIKFSPILYGIGLIALVGVLFTERINGAASWFQFGTFSIQPSEFAKIFSILLFSYVAVIFQKKGRNQINKFWKLLLCILIMAAPTALIVLQPDYGTAGAFIFATAFMFFVSGIKARYIIACILIVAISVPLLYIYVLPEHAKQRIDIFLNPESDARGAGYNIIQSKLAIGAGQLWGMGLLKGNQTQLGYLYPKTTDFIFSVIGEEMGFIASSIIIILYIVIITKAIYIGKTAKNDLGSYIAMGIAGIFSFHMIENIGMTMGLLPITGIPLPFVSYGGSSLLTNFACIGILLSISGRRQKSIFVE